MATMFLDDDKLDAGSEDYLRMEEDTPMGLEDDNPIEDDPDEDEDDDIEDPEEDFDDLDDEIDEDEDEE